jgi:hypothetical protein
MITFNCPSCNQSTQWPPELAGKGVFCPACDHSFCVPFQKPAPLPKSPAKAADPVYTMEGRDYAALFVYEDRLTIISSGAHKTIPFRSITAIRHAFAGMLNGHLEFTIPGSVERQTGAFIDSDGDFGVGVSGGNNMFVYTNGFFGKAKNDERALEIKCYIESQIEVLRSKDLSPPPASGGIASELEKLAELHTLCILSDDEFQAAKRRLLGG